MKIDPDYLRELMKDNGLTLLSHLGAGAGPGKITIARDGGKNTLHVYGAVVYDRKKDTERRSENKFYNQIIQKLKAQVRGRGEKERFPKQRELSEHYDDWKKEAGL